MLGVFLRHVCGIGCGAGVKFTDMGRDALVMKINFQQVLAGMNFYRLADGGASADVSDLALEERENAILAIEWPRPPFTELPAWRVEIREEKGGVRRIRVERR